MNVAPILEPFRGGMLPAADGLPLTSPARIKNDTINNMAMQIKTGDIMTTGDFALVISIINSVLILAVLMDM